MQCKLAVGLSLKQQLYTTKQRPCTFLALPYTVFIVPLQTVNCGPRKLERTSGIPGGYRLVSTYDLPDCKTILKFEIWSFSDLGGEVFWDTWIWTLWQFSFWGRYSGTLGFGLSDNFHFGGVFWDIRIWTLWQFSFGGGILGHSDLDSLTIFILGGYSGTLGFGLSDNFHLGGGYSVPSYYRIGVFCGIWTKISTTPAGSCITDSLSHTTYVETNNTKIKSRPHWGQSWGHVGHLWTDDPKEIFQCPNVSSWLVPCTKRSGLWSENPIYCSFLSDKYSCGVYLCK